MANDIQKFFSGHTVPDRDKLSQALAGLSATKKNLTGKALLKLSPKKGVWLFGQDNEQMAEGTQLVADPATLQTGYIAWWMGQVESEKMQPASLGPVDPATLGEVNSGGIPPGKKEASGKGWENQLSIELITRDKLPLSLIYKTSTMGGTDALLGLAGRMYHDMDENPQRRYAVIEIYVGSYIRKESGNEVFTPGFTIVGWLDAEGKDVKELRSLL